MSGQKIPLQEIRERIVLEHAQLGVINVKTDEFYDAVTKEQVNNRLAQLGESINCTGNLNERKKYLKNIERTRHLML